MVAQATRSDYATNFGDLFTVVTAVASYGSATSLDTATAADVAAGSSSSVAVTPAALAGALAGVTLTDAASIAWDMSVSKMATVTITADRTLAAPSNPSEGQTYYFFVFQDTTGGWLMTWPSSFDWGTAGAPTLTTTASQGDLIELVCDDAVTPKFRARVVEQGLS